MSNIGHVLCGIMDHMQTVIVTEQAKLVKVPPDAPSWTVTERVLARMLRENTGASILDSGGTYGRSWQRNLRRDFAKIPDSTVKFHIEHDDKLWVNITHDLFHWLAMAVEYDRPMTKLLRQFGKTPEFEHESWFEVMQSFPEWLTKERWKKHKGCTIGGIYGEGNPVTINTYNDGGECLTSQDFQFTYFTCCGGPREDEEFAAIFVHNGADARGGYTAPVIFKAPMEADMIGLFDYRRASVAPDWDEVKLAQEALRQAAIDQPALFPALDRQRLIEIDDFREIRWNTEDGGYHLSWEGSTKLHGRELHTYPVRAIDHRSEWKPGEVCVLPDDTGLCPITGCTLQSWFF